MDVARFLVAVRVAERRLDLAFAYQVVEGGGLIVVEQVRALVALLEVPEVANVHHGVVAAGAGADDHHATTVADEDRRGDGVLARMVEDDAGARPLAQDVPDRLAERLRAVEPR